MNRMTVPINTGGVPTNRRNRVSTMLAKTRKNSNRLNSPLQRGVGTRRLVPTQHLRFSNTVNSKNENETSSANLQASRESIPVTPPRFRNVRLNERQSKLFANLSAAYNDPADMLDTLKILAKRIYAMYGN